MWVHGCVLLLRAYGLNDRGVNGCQYDSVALLTKVIYSSTPKPLFHNLGFIYMWVIL